MLASRLSARRVQYSTLFKHQRHFSSASYGLQARLSSRKKIGALITVAAAVATVTAVSASSKVHNDAPADAPSISKDSLPLSRTSVAEELATFVWGSNQNGTILPSSKPSPKSIRTPFVASHLSGVALRDLAFHEKHAACIDARGDVYQWGDGFFDSPGASEEKEPKLTLRGQDITHLAVTHSRVFALSRAGQVFVLPSSQSADIPTTTTESKPSSSWLNWIWKEDKNGRPVELRTDIEMARRERIVSISAGRDHLLALTSSGRTLAHPFSKNANSHGQLGTRKVYYQAPSPADVPSDRVQVHVELVPLAQLDPYAKSSRVSRQPSSDAESTLSTAALEGVQHCNTLFEIPSLRGVRIAQAVAGDRSSFVRTEDGKVLGWGANEYGQLGLGASFTMECIPVPTEVTLSRHYSARTPRKCIDITAGGDVAFFTIQRQDYDAPPVIDILACGMGQWGALGSGQYTQAQGSPVKVKTVSGLLEFDETTRSLQPIRPDTISVSPTGHVLFAFEASSGPVKSPAADFGRDLLSWGANTEYQQGNGKKTNVATPTYVTDWDKKASSGSEPEAVGEESRLMLRGTRVAEVKDMSGKRVLRNAVVEQTPVAGWNCSAIYWRVR